MRKSTAAVLAVGSAFALTAAMASAVSLTGPFDPAAGADAATSCDPGTVTVEPMVSGTQLAGFKLTTEENTGAQATCVGAKIWLRVDYTELPGGALKSTYAGNLTALGDYTRGQDITWDLGWFRTSIMGNAYTPRLDLAATRIDSTRVLVMEGTPTNFDFPRSSVCFENAGPGPADLDFDAKMPVASFGTLGNIEVYNSTDGSCSGGLTTLGGEVAGKELTLVGAEHEAAARAWCRQAGATLVTRANTLGWTDAPTTWWVCLSDAPA